jgi:hypothetical protein
MSRVYGTCRAHLHRVQGLVKRAGAPGTFLMATIEEGAPYAGPAAHQLRAV